MFWIGFAIGSALVIFLKRYVSDSKKAVGSLRVDQSDPTEPPYIFLELSKPLDKILPQKSIVLRIVVKNYLTRK